MRQAVLSYICAGVWRRWEGLIKPEVGQKADVQEAGVQKAIKRLCLRKPAVMIWAKGKRL